MGMFDYVRCDFPLPEPELQSVVFQTKDLPEPHTGSFRVTAGGALVNEWTPRKDELVMEVVSGPLRLNHVTDVEYITVTLRFEDRRAVSAEVEREPLGRIEP